MPSKKLKSPLTPDSYYHIYNRGNNKERLFYSNDDYQFFLDKFEQYVAPYAEVYAFCLIPNHFHLLLKTRNELYPSKSVVPNQLRKLFICYTKRINFHHKRSGSLFTKNYCRIEIKDETYLHHVVNYIHKNPRKHGICHAFENYNYSSYKIIIGSNKTILRRENVIYWFGGISEFIEFHRINETDPGIYKKYIIRDEDESKTDKN